MSRYMSATEFLNTIQCSLLDSDICEKCYLANNEPIPCLFFNPKVVRTQVCPNFVHKTTKQEEVSYEKYTY